MKIIKEKTFYKTLLTLAIPIALQNIITVGVSMLDTVMLVWLDQSALSASMLANQPYFILTLVFFGISGGASVLTAQYWGKKDVKTIRKIMGMSIRYAFIAALALTVLAVFAPRFVLGLYTDKPVLIDLGAKYLRIIGFSYALSAVTVVYLGIIRSMENVRIATGVYLMSMVVNGFFNYLLIFGNLGFPALGIEGAAYATLIARAAELVSVIFYSRYKEKILKFSLKDLFYRNRVLFGDYLRYALPVVLNELAWSLGITVQSSVLGHMSEDAVAASSIISVLSRLVTVAVFGVANATAVIIGNSVGTGREKEARERASTLLIISVGLGIAASGLILLIRPLVPAVGEVVSLTPQAVGLLQKMMLSSAMYTFFQAFNGTNIIGVLRGGGDSKFGLFLDCSALWITSLILGPLFGFVFRLPVEWVYFVMLLDEPIKVFPGLWRFVSGRWLRNVTREQPA